MLCTLRKGVNLGKRSLKVSTGVYKFKKRTTEYLTTKTKQKTPTSDKIESSTKSFYNT